MSAHGSYAPITLAEKQSRDDVEMSEYSMESVAGRGADVRHIFERVALEGASFETAPPTESQREVRDRMARLSQKMSTCFPWPDLHGKSCTDDFNEAIPAGYTYLAQLAAHDLVASVAPLPRAGEHHQRLSRDFRSERLVLDTIYGGGPDTGALPYAIEKGPGRFRLRLGQVRPQPEVPPPGCPANDPMEYEAARDIPRVSCPFLNDTPGAGRPDALIADPRNDDHLIISQLTALFHELHNKVFDLLSDPEADASAVRYQFDVYRTFLQTRKVVALVYRRIVVNDLLKRLLHPEVYKHYTDPGLIYPDEFLDPMLDNQVPIEFSHAVFRFGHVMVRPAYKINDDLPDGNPSLADLLDRSSARRSELLPLACNWLVDWKHFFGTSEDVTPSRCIRPYARGVLSWGDKKSDYFPNEEGQVGGIFYRDFVRGAEAGVLSVQALAEKIPEALKQHSTLLSNKALREQKLEEWLQYSPSHGAELKMTVKDIDALKKDPPLLFYVLLEAAQEMQGKCLGVLGSVVVGETFFAALARGRESIETDTEVRDAAARVFDGDIPATMPKLIEALEELGGLQSVSCPAPAGQPPSA